MNRTGNLSSANNYNAFICHPLKQRQWSKAEHKHMCTESIVYLCQFRKSSAHIQVETDCDSSSSENRFFQLFRRRRRRTWCWRSSSPTDRPPTTHSDGICLPPFRRASSPSLFPMTLEGFRTRVLLLQCESRSMGQLMSSFALLLHFKMRLSWFLASGRTSFGHFDKRLYVSVLPRPGWKYRELSLKNH